MEVGVDLTDGQLLSENTSECENPDIVSPFDVDNHQLHFGGEHPEEGISN